MQSHDGRPRDIGQCPTCGATSPLLNPRSPFFVGLFIVVALALAIALLTR